MRSLSSGPPGVPGLLVHACVLHMIQECKAYRINVLIAIGLLVYQASKFRASWSARPPELKLRRIWKTNPPPLKTHACVLHLLQECKAYRINVLIDFDFLVYQASKFRASWIARLPELVLRRS